MRTGIPFTTAIVLALTIGLGSQDAHAFGIPLQPLNIQVQTTTSAAGDLNPTLLTPTGMAVWFARQLITPPSLREVQWTTKNDTSVNTLSVVWGIKPETLVALNPHLTLESPVPSGSRIVVFRMEEENPTQSIGRPNRGRLINAVPFPEGPFWTLRDSRKRAWATKLTVFTLTHALTEYGKAYPDGPRVRIGELSQRKGGRIRPHKSHRTGRDADIGYIVEGDDGEGLWHKASPNTIDAKKTLFFVLKLIETGNVQAIYMDRRIQKRLAKIAKRRGMPEEELARIFEHPRRPNSHKAIIQHWAGHSRHMHIRFRCESWNARCKAW